jgi:phage-related minor tail protein
MEEVADIESPYPPTDGSDADDWMSGFSKPWEAAARSTASIAQASKEVSKHIPEARTIQKELEAAGEDPVAVMEAAKAGVDFWSGTIIPQLKDMGANSDALEKADDYMKTQVQESIFELEDMGEHLDAISGIINNLLPKWIEARDATEDDNDGPEPEEKKVETETIIRSNDGRLLLTEKQLKRLVRRLIIN